MCWLDVIIVGIMDAMAGTTAVAVDADVVITTDAVEEIPSVKLPPGILAGLQ